MITESFRIAGFRTHVLRLLAQRIKFFRREKEWSREQLAEESAAMQRSYLADLERDTRNPSVRTLVEGG